MIKKIFVLGIIVLVVVFGGCKLDINSEVKDNISDIRFNLFEGETEDYYATLSCGMREEPYAFDGVANKLREFGIVCVSFKNTLPETFNYFIQIGSMEFEGVLEENPYDHSYMIDLEKIVSCDASLYFSLNAGSEILLSCVSRDWKVKYDEALEIGLNYFKEDLPNLFKNKKFQGEVYLKIVYDQKNFSAPYYWYFNILTPLGDKYTVVIDTQSGEIVTDNRS